GAARMAIEARVPIIPVGLTGPDKILPKGAKFPNFNTKMTAQIGEPITIHEKYFGKTPSHDELMGVMAHVMDKIKELLKY
nr:1-acyl-sn-glycerol-3-phosphate acyltransferase [Candidatus Sigynarchaeota archaeon]